MPYCALCGHTTKKADFADGPQKSSTACAGPIAHALIGHAMAAK